MHSHSCVVATSEESCPGSGADRTGNVEIGKPRALCSHAVEIGCFVSFRAEDSNICIPLVICEHQNNIRGCCSFRVSGYCDVLFGNYAKQGQEEDDDAWSELVHKVSWIVPVHFLR